MDGAPEHVKDRLLSNRAGTPFDDRNSTRKHPAVAFSSQGILGETRENDIPTDARQQGEELKKKAKKTEESRRSSRIEEINNGDRIERVDEGLCANCAKRTQCRLPQPEGGVWHCEDYCEE